MFTKHPRWPQERELTAGQDRVEGTADGVMKGLQAAERCRLLNTRWWRPRWRWGGGWLWWNWWVDLWPYDAAAAAVQPGNKATTVYCITRGFFPIPTMKSHTFFLSAHTALRGEVTPKIGFPGITHLHPNSLQAFTVLLTGGCDEKRRAAQSPGRNSAGRPPPGDCAQWGPGKRCLASSVHWPAPASPAVPPGPSLSTTRTDGHHEDDNDEDDNEYLPKSKTVWYAWSSLCI